MVSFSRDMVDGKKAMLYPVCENQTTEPFFNVMDLALDFSPHHGGEKPEG